MELGSDFIYEKLSHRNFRRLKECQTVLQWLDPKPRERILDIGCGDGFYDRKIAKHGAKVVGIDISTKGLETARHKNAVEGVEFHHMNAEELDFPEGSFDKVVSFCVIEHFNDDDKVLAGIARVLAPGGRLVFSADSLSNPEITSDEREHHRRRYAVNNFYEKQMIATKLERAGFRVDRVKYLLTTPVALAIARLTWRLDDLPHELSLLKKGAYIVCNWIGKVISDFSELVAARPDSGLTLVVSATKAALKR